MIRQYLVITGLFFSVKLMAQTGIGTTSPDPSAKLEVNATNKGFLPPRVALTSVTDISTITSPATGLLVYNTGNNAGLAAGYYFWNGANWATIATAGGSGSVAAEFGSQILQSGVTINSATPIDVLSFTLPSAGTWEVITFLRAQGVAGYAAEFAIYDNSNNLVPNSEILPAYGEIGSTGTGVVRISTTGAAIYKLKAWASGGAAAPYNVSTDGNGRSGVTWKKISGNSPMTVINFGDIKTGIQSGDHSGWVKLDGRVITTLSASQQTQATALGIISNLPDATNAVLMQSSGSLGSVTGSMSRTLAQNQLPNIAPSITVDNTIATMQNAGSHQHSISVVSSSIGGYAAGNPTAFKKDMAPTSESNADLTDRGGGSLVNTGIIGSAGDHNHIINSHVHTATSTSINGGVAQQSIDITPRRLVVNTFIYLGY
jgi:hypothetical protein